MCRGFWLASTMLLVKTRVSCLFVLFARKGRGIDPPSLHVFSVQCSRQNPCARRIFNKRRRPLCKVLCKCSTLRHISTRANVLEPMTMDSVVPMYTHTIEFGILLVYFRSTHNSNSKKYTSSWLLTSRVYQSRLLL